MRPGHSPRSRISPGWLAAFLVPPLVFAAAGRAELKVDFYGLLTPGGTQAIQQGSDLHWGRLGERHGLWLVCDRNGGPTAGRLYYISAGSLAAAKTGTPIVADEAFTVAPPAEGWDRFLEANKGIGPEVLAELRRRIEPDGAAGEERFLDLEAITFAPGIAAPDHPHLFAVAEEPHSLVLELALEGGRPSGLARLAGVYAYHEKPEEHGTAVNDGLEGLAYGGKPGWFYFAEEGTRSVDDQERSQLLFSLDPRLGAAELKGNRVHVDQAPTDRLTTAIRSCRKSKMQTLNAITTTRDGRILAVDRNGGWIDTVDPQSGEARPWLNLYDLDGVNLRTVLAEFPHKRAMPYVSIEGIAVDDAGAIWLVDDPAMPEGWRESCLVRLSGTDLKPAPATRPAGAAPRGEVGHRSDVPWPRTAMLWSSIRGDGSLEAVARHDLALLGAESLGLRWNRQPAGQADGFTAESIAAARKRLAELRGLNPHLVVLSEMLFYEWPDAWLPEHHAWWLRKDGRRQQFWPGTHRMNWYDAEYRRLIVRRVASLQESGVDGVFFDNLREEPEPWTALLKAVRERVGSDFLVLANSGYAVGRHDFAAPFLNGFMYESGWSHDRREWDDTIARMRHSESLLMRPRISVIERFEDTGSRAGWPGDAGRGRKPPPDPAARRWSLCYALIIGDYYYLFADNTSHHHDWYAEYDTKLGRPVEAGRRLSPFVWERRFERGRVIVNLPGATESYRVTVESEAVDTLSGERSRSFPIPPGDGRILHTP